MTTVDPDRGGAAPVRVVYVDHSAKLSGAELALLRLLPHVPHVAPHVILAEPGPLVAKLQEAGLPVEVLPLSRRTGELRRDAVTRRIPVRALLDTFLYSLRLAHRLRRLAPDLVHTNSNKSHLYGGLAARLAGVPQVWHVRDRVVPEFMPAPAVGLMQRAARLLPGTVIANSASTLATVPGARTPPDGLAVLHDPVVTEDFGSIRADREGPLVVGMLGRLTPWKGQDLFLRAFAGAFAGRTDVRARIIGSALYGEDEYAAGLDRIAHDLGIEGLVEFAGFQDDVPGALADLDVLVHASVIPEPFGQVVVEGLAARLPVVASGEGGPAEVITDGVDGLLFTARDAGALAAALLRVTADPALRAALGAAARRRSLDFAPGVLGAQLAAVYRGLLG